MLRHKILDELQAALVQVILQARDDSTSGDSRKTAAWLLQSCFNCRDVLREDGRNGDKNWLMRVYSAARSAFDAHAKGA